MRLQQHDETPIIRHVKVKGEASPYDGNLIYWSSRMGTHPEATKRVATLLKKQRGRYNHCGLYFREEDVLEIDHIIPKSKDGKDEYKNLQISCSTLKLHTIEKESSAVLLSCQPKDFSQPARKRTCKKP